MRSVGTECSPSPEVGRLELAPSSQLAVAQVQDQVDGVQHAPLFGGLLQRPRRSEETAQCLVPGEG